MSKIWICYQCMVRMIESNNGNEHQGKLYYPTPEDFQAAWHFTACKIKDKTIRPCLYKQFGLV